MATTSWTPSIYLRPAKRPSQYLPVYRWPLTQAWLPAFLFLCIFAIESTAAFGADHTSAPLHSLLRFLFGASVDPNWSEIHHMLRKTGHFLAYGSFSLACFHGFSLTLRRLATRIDRSFASHTLAIAATFLAASADEFHQTFLPNRTGCFSDVLLDTSGALTLQLILLLTLRLTARAARVRRAYPAHLRIAG